jgi:hypothetical protein
MRERLERVSTGPINPERPNELMRWSAAVAKLERELLRIRFIKP